MNKYILMNMRVLMNKYILLNMHVLMNKYILMNKYVLTSLLVNKLWRAYHVCVCCHEFDGLYLSIYYYYSVV